MERTPKMKISEKIKQGRKRLGLTQTEFGKKLGVQKNAVSKWECGRVEDIPSSKIKIMAELFRVPVSYLIDDMTSNVDYFQYDNVFSVQTKKFPMLGEIACGKPIYADEDRESYVQAGMGIKADFCLKCKGDSMINARILDGDIVFVHKQSAVNNGEIGVVIIENEATLKRIYYYPEQQKLVLQSENPKYEPLVYVGSELEQIYILGKAIAFQSDVR